MLSCPIAWWICKIEWFFIWVNFARFAFLGCEHFIPLPVHREHFPLQLRHWPPWTLRSQQVFLHHHHYHHHHSHHHQYHRTPPHCHHYHSNKYHYCYQHHYPKLQTNLCLCLLRAVQFSRRSPVAFNSSYGSCTIYDRLETSWRFCKELDRANFFPFKLCSPPSSKISWRISQKL